MASNNTAVTFTSREMEVLALVWQCMEIQPKIDMTKLASLTGYTPGSASVTLSKIKQKIKLLGNIAASNGPATPKKTGGGREKTTPSTPSKRGASAGGNATPSKRARKRKGGVREEQGYGDDDDDDDEDFGSEVVKKEEEDGVVAEVKDEDKDGDAGGYGFLDGIEGFGREG